MLGVVISVAGFIWTIVAVVRSKSSAERAEQAAEAVRQNQLKIDTIARIHSAIQILADIKRHQRNQAWYVLPDRYNEVCSLLKQIAGEAEYLMTNEQMTIFTSAVTQLRDIEKKIDQAIENDKAPQNKVSNLNNHVTDQADKLTEVLGQLRQKVGQIDE
jgi:vacuolar-type H+-ATPase subunit I/STV1